LCNTCRIPAKLSTRLISLCCNQTPKNWKLGICPFNLPLFGVWWQYKDLQYRARTSAPSRYVQGINKIIISNLHTLGGDDIITKSTKFD
jgi:hypothetical protein